MKRATKTQTEIRKEIYERMQKEEEANMVRQRIEAAKEKDAARPRIGPKTPVILPYKENEMFY